MKSIWKKRLAVLLAAVMVLSMAAPAYAGPSDNDNAVPAQTVSGEASATEPDAAETEPVVVSDIKAPATEDPQVSDDNVPETPAVEEPAAGNDETGNDMDVSENETEPSENEAQLSINEIPVSVTEAETAAYGDEDEAWDGEKTGSLLRLIEENQTATITLKKNVSLSSQLFIDKGKNITIDLSGCTLKATGAEAGGLGTFEVSINGTGTVLTLTDSEYSASGKEPKGRFSVSKDGGIAVFNGAELFVENVLLEDNVKSSFLILASGKNTGVTVRGGRLNGEIKAADNSTLTLDGGYVSGNIIATTKMFMTEGVIVGDVTSDSANGKITISGGSIDGNLVTNSGGTIGITGGKFNADPSLYIAEGHGKIKYASAPVYKYEVLKKTDVYLLPELNDPFVIKGRTLSESGIRTGLYDPDKKRITGITVNNGKYVKTNKDGSSVSDQSISEVFGVTGTYYIAAMDDAGNRINITDDTDATIDKTGIYNIKNPDSVSRDWILQFDVEDGSADKLELNTITGKSLFYGKTITDPFEYFTVNYIHGSYVRPLDKKSGVTFFWDLDKERIKVSTNKTYTYSNEDAGTIVYVRAEYLSGLQPVFGNIMIERQPVVIEAASRISTLVGQELTPRYYQKINVYALSIDRISKESIIESGAAISDWTDVTSSVIDLDGISNMKRGHYENTVLSDIRNLSEEKKKNYELEAYGTITYDVEPSIILDFKVPAREESIAARKILSTDTKFCTIMRFSNGKSTVSAQWMVKQISYNSVDDVDYEKIVLSNTVGISTKPTFDGKGTEFTFDGIDRINGGAYTLYEIFPNVRIATDSNKSLTVTSIMPVIYDGSRFVATDDMNYYSMGVPKAGYSPVLDIRVYDGDTKLKIGTDYTLSYKNNRDAGDEDSDNVPTVNIKGKGIYSGMSITAYFTILPADFNMIADVRINNQYFKYNGSFLKPQVEVYYKTGANAGKKINAKDYSLEIYDEQGEAGREVTNVKYKKSSGFHKFYLAIVSKEDNLNFSGVAGEDKFFYGIPRNSQKFSVGGLVKTVKFTDFEGAGVENFIKRGDFFAKIPKRKFNYEDVENGILNVSLVDSTDENVAQTYTSLDSAGTYYLKVELADFADRYDYYVFEPTYIKVNYSGKQLTGSNVKLKKNSLLFDGLDHDLTLKIDRGVLKAGRLDNIKVRIYKQGGEIIYLSDLMQDPENPTDEVLLIGGWLENQKTGRYKIGITGEGYYSGSYFLNYTVSVRNYNARTTPATVYVNTVSSDDPDDSTERAVPYRSDGKYDNSMVKVVWKNEDGSTFCLRQADEKDRSAQTGDYYVEWGTFKQVGEKKGVVYIVGTGTYFNGRIKRNFDVAQSQ